MLERHTVVSRCPELALSRAFLTGRIIESIGHLTGGSEAARGRRQQPAGTTHSRTPLTADIGNLALAPNARFTARLRTSSPSRDHHFADVLGSCHPSWAREAPPPPGQPFLSTIGEIAVPTYQISVGSEISMASSTSMPGYRTVDSSFEWPSSSCTARRFFVRR